MHLSCLLPICSFWKCKYIYFPQFFIYFLFLLVFLKTCRVLCRTCTNFQLLGQNYKLFTEKFISLLSTHSKSKQRWNIATENWWRKERPSPHSCQQENTATCHAMQNHIKKYNTLGNTDQEEKHHIITQWTFLLVCIALCKQTHNIDNSIATLQL